MSSQRPVSNAAGRRLEALADIRRALRERERVTEEDAARADQARAAEQRERELFSTSVGRVAPLRRPAPAPSPRTPPSATPRQRQRDDAAVLVEAMSDTFDATTLLDVDADLSYRRPGLGPDIVRKLRRGVWTLQGDLDLHGLRRDEARQRVDLFLRDAARAGLRCVRIVHGKGLGSPGREPVLKHKVKSWLAQRTEVLAFTHARAADGGHGALIVLLAPPAPRER